MSKWIKRSLLALLLVLLALFVTVWWLLRGSLPPLQGELVLPGLSAPVTIDRDALGVVTIDAANENDAMRALGYVHAQERYFEMDLLRRTAAGELAELFGPVAIDTDKEHRVHRMRARVTRSLNSILGDKRPLAQAYVDGVNAGLRSLRTRPWPYLLLRKQPAPWRLEDSALTGYAMYFDLQDADNTRELALWKLRPHLPASLYALLARDGTSWDAPLIGTPRGDARTAGCVGGGPAQAADAGRSASAAKPAAVGRGQQQLRRVAAQLTARRSRDRRRRHAPGPARAEHLVPCATALSRCRAP